MIVIGAGRIGTGVARNAAESGEAITLVDRVTGWEALKGAAGAPVILAVRNDDLVEVLGRIPDHRRADVVFVQNGAIRELLNAQGLAGATRGVLYVMAAGGDAPPVPGATNVFSGPHAQAVAGWFGRIGLPSEAVASERFAWFELEKLLWLACHGLLCERHGATVGEVASAHRTELEALVRELLPVGEAAWGADPDPGWVLDHLVAYSASIPGYRASVKEWRWRNGWLRDAARRAAIPTPLHDTLLEQTGHPR